MFFFPYVPFFTGSLHKVMNGAKFHALPYVLMCDCQFVNCRPTRTPRNHRIHRRRDYSSGPNGDLSLQGCRRKSIGRDLMVQVRKKERIFMSQRHYTAGPRPFFLSSFKEWNCNCFDKKNSFYNFSNATLFSIYFYAVYMSFYMKFTFKKSVRFQSKFVWDMRYIYETYQL